MSKCNQLNMCSLVNFKSLNSGNWAEVVKFWYSEKKNNRIKVSDDREKSNGYYLSVLTITHKSY